MKKCNKENSMDKEISDEQNNTEIPIKKQEAVEDPLTELLRNGARKLLAEALEAEIESFIEQYTQLRDERGKKRVVRNGYLPERKIQTGIGAVSVKAPRARDRKKGKEKIRFTSEILPPYLRKTRSLEELIPWLYLKGISTGDFSEALIALVGKDAKGFSPNVISRLKAKWQNEYEEWQKRDLSDKRYIYVWVDGIYCNVRMDDKQCLLVMIGVTEEGNKELLALEGGYRESEISWKEILLDIKSRGLFNAPFLAVGDGSLGFWNAIAKVYPKTNWQRCWVHKTANVLNKLPKSLQSQAKKKLHAIWMAPDKKEAEKNFYLFIETYKAKYPKAAECLEKDRDVLLRFYDFPAEHWKSIRTTNPIESTFATVRLRTKKVRGCFSANTALTMAFKLCQSAERRWRKFARADLLQKLVTGAKFIDGEQALTKETQALDNNRKTKPINRKKKTKTPKANKKIKTSDAKKENQNKNSQVKSTKGKPKNSKTKEGLKNKFQYLL